MVEYPTTQEGARQWLVDAIGRYSEEKWAAGWMMGIEDEVRREGGIWRVMALLAGGWPRLSERPRRDQDGHEYVPWVDLMDWEPMTEEELAEAKAMARRMLDDSDPLERSDDPYCAQHGRRFDPAVGCPGCLGVDP